MVPLRAFRKILVVLAVALASAAVAAFLPDDPYQRWQLLDGTIHANARWIYERIHFDPKPIDVVFLGPSRMGAGVNAPRLAQALEARGLPSNVVNFSLPETGRNINWAVAEQLFAAKKPKLLVLGVIEKPSRYGHSAYKYLARRRDIVDPGYLADVNYVSDLIYLPFRQMRLFGAGWFPDAFGLARRFDPARYRGPSVDTTGSLVLPDGHVKDGENPASHDELVRGVRKLEGGNHPPFLPASLADVEFGDERHYVRKIAEMAQKNGVRVAFVFLPYYTGPSALADVQERTLYERYGPVLNAGFLSTHAEWYADYGHLTRHGAEVLTDWLVGPVAQWLGEAGT
ncbi:hypothetical protein DFR50_102248 [Roseiarcus fermentans]|uniref:SGNH/GDSL hydrolase family protein n=1 Tax=Roseiarcus fermentans TaxID=1473586 RepID=A0A366FVI0_9HYPH|nr:hypothetical protein [Roseiarcus fermentans]RBP17755.1 hypothetical protein DFR50_102248 [Roseiarcus fermentans]